MLGFLGGIAGAAANLVGGLFGQRNQEQINQQNLAESRYQATHAIQERVEDAKRAGINPLAALGSSFQPTAPSLVGSDALPSAMSGMGQNLSRAASAFQDATSREQKLKEDLLQAQINQTNVTTTGEMLRNSKLAGVVAPGSPPPMPVNVPLPRPAPHTVDTLPLFQDYRDRLGNRFTLFDPEAQRSIFSGVPGAVSYPALATSMAIENARQTGPVVRGDLQRVMENLTSSSVDNPWLWQQ